MHLQCCNICIDAVMHCTTGVNTNLAKTSPLNLHYVPKNVGCSIPQTPYRSRGLVLSVLALAVDVVLLERLPDVGHHPLRVLHQHLAALLVVGEAVDRAGRLGLELRVGLQQRPLLLRQRLGHVDLHVDVVVPGAVPGGLGDALALEEDPTEKV